MNNIIFFYSSGIKLPSKEKQSRKGVLKHILHQLEIFCDKTTLHGLRYVGDKTLTIAERWTILNKIPNT